MSPWNYGLVFLFGCLVGIAELISRHSDHRVRAVTTPPSLMYRALNGALSIFALILIDYVKPEWLGYRSGTDGTATEPANVWIVLTAGFGAATFFRSSIFKLKTQDGDMSVGPAFLIDVFLNVIDEAVDRVIGEQRLIEVSKIMADVDFAKASKSLPTFCFAGLRRLSPDVQRQFAFQLKELVDAQDMSDRVKSVSLGLAVMNLTGMPILTAAVNRLGDEIKPTTTRQPDRTKA